MPSLQQALELDKRLAVEIDLVDIRQRDATLFQAISNRPGRETCIVFLARKTYFLGRFDNVVITKQSHRTDMVIS